MIVVGTLVVACGGGRASNELGGMEAALGVMAEVGVWMATTVIGIGVGVTGLLVLVDGMLHTVLLGG